MEQIKGLLTCKPENTPHAGEVRKYVVDTPVSQRTGKQWTKISNDNDGSPYTVISVAKTKFESDRGFVSFNVVIEPAPVQKYYDRVGPEGHPDEMPQNAPVATQEAPVGHFNQLPHQSSQKPPNVSQQDYNTALGHHGVSGPGRQPHQTPLSKDDYWTIKDQRDREREARQVAQQPRIERQHSQGVAAQLAAAFPATVLDADGSVNLGKLHTLITWFQRDIGYIPKGENEPF